MTGALMLAAMLVTQQPRGSNEATFMPTYKEEFSAVSAPRLDYCPSSDNLCMGCYRHARLVGCSSWDCAYLAYYRINLDGSVTCVWVSFDALKHFR